MDKKNDKSNWRENNALPKMGNRKVFVEEKESTRLAEVTILSSEEKELMAIAEETEHTLLAEDKQLVENV